MKLHAPTLVVSTLLAAFLAGCDSRDFGGAPAEANLLFFAHTNPTRLEILFRLK